MARITRKQIEGRVDYYNRLMGTKFQVSYRTGYGYDMFEKDPDCGAERRNYVGFDARKSATGTYEYINGLIACAEAIKYGYLEIK